MMKVKILLILLVLSNMEWLFIMANYGELKALYDFRQETIVNNQKRYLQELSPRVDLIKEDNNKKQSPRVDQILTGGELSPRVDLIPNKIILPSINKESPVFQSMNEGNDELLNKGVIDFKTNKKGYYIFGHSSSKYNSPYRFIFTNITKIGKGDIVSLEFDKKILIFKYKDAFYKKPEKLNELQEGDYLYLITCYPFNSTYTRYVVQLSLEKEINR